MKQKSKEEWRALIKLQRDGSLSIKGFCQQHNISTSCFYKNKKFLNVAKGDSLSQFVKVKTPLLNRPSIESIKIQFQQSTINFPITIESVWLASFVKALA